jgi:hypothetical protein
MPTLITDFDETIGNIDIIPQDIGRVILNLITNAFYAKTTAPAYPPISSTKSSNPSSPPNPPDREPGWD